MKKYPRISSCQGKKAFTSPELARAAANRRRQRMAYRCSHCGLWHVGTTHRSKDRKRPTKRVVYGI